MKFAEPTMLASRSRDDESLACQDSEIDFQDSQILEYQDLDWFRFSKFQSTMIPIHAFELAFVARMVSEAWACTAAQQMCAALEYIHFKADGSWDSWVSRDVVSAVGPTWVFTIFWKNHPPVITIFYRFYRPFPNGWFILIYGIVLPTLAYYIEATNQMFIAQDGIEWWGAWWFLPININESGLMLTVQQCTTNSGCALLLVLVDYLTIWLLMDSSLLWNGAFPGWKD